MSSETIYAPYFYIIQHKTTRKLYAGARWAEGCHPDEFMKPKGYTTSSVTINNIIEQEGLEAFDILRLDTNLDGLSAYDYETLFLQENDCAGSDDWLNKHNNDWGHTLGTDSFKKNMLEKYGFEHSSYIQEFKDKIKLTKLEKYGDENYSNRDKSKATMMERYGVEHALQSKFYLDKSKATMMERYGVESSNLVQEIKDKKTATHLERYGVKQFNNRKKAIQTCLERYGVESSNSLQETQDKKVVTCLEKYGVDWVLQSDQVREKSKNTLLKIYGVDNISKFKFFSIISTRKEYAKCTLSKWYPEFKQFY